MTIPKAIKWQDLLEEGKKNGRNAFQKGAKIHFREKMFWGQGHIE